jgi:2-oxoglutarate ferredoxin oxidoreductase subunit alpha
MKAGLLRLKTVWPMPTERFAALAARAGRIIIPEMNYGQLRGEVERFTAGKPVIGVNRADGEVITPESILKVMEEGEEK